MPSTRTDSGCMIMRRVRLCSENDNKVDNKNERFDLLKYLQTIH